ncbi:MAG TPA: hypothetical protein VK045_05315 [Ornithinicoccus sp.]|nr:hypothetical protein [Ornithinicoccus sp.]
MPAAAGGLLGGGTPQGEVTVGADEVNGDLARVALVRTTGSIPVAATALRTAETAAGLVEAVMTIAAVRAAMMTVVVAATEGVRMIAAVRAVTMIAVVVATRGVMTTAVVVATAAATMIAVVPVEMMTGRAGIAGTHHGVGRRGLTVRTTHASRGQGPSASPSRRFPSTSRRGSSTRLPVASSSH